MKKLLSITVLLLFGTIGIFAQSITPSAESSQTSSFNSKAPTKSPEVRKARQTTGSDDYKKGEVFVGYSFSDSRLRLYNRDSRLQSVSRLDRTFSLRDKFKRGFTVAANKNLNLPPICDSASELNKINLILEVSPAPCKFVMKEMGLLEENLCLPLVPITEPTRNRLKEILKKLQIK